MHPSVSKDSCQLLGGFFATLAHTTRMRIFCALQRNAKTVTEIAAEAGISITNASQHLRLMRDRGAVKAEKQGQNVYYQIADQRFVEAATLIRLALSEQLRNRAEDAAARAPQSKLARVFQPAR